jgi:hypothetical protein
MYRGEGRIVEKCVKQHTQSEHRSSRAGAETPADNLFRARCLTKGLVSFGGLLVATPDVFRQAETRLLRR